LYAMTRRHFDQQCPIAEALDVVGERWSLLIVRELLLGPKRYTDLRRALSRMWTNLLADRLRHLERAEVIEQVELPPPSARTVYQLTDRGRGLEPVVLGLGLWGIPLFAGRRKGNPPLSTSVLLGVRAFFQPASVQTEERYELRIGGQPFTASVQRGRLNLRSGQPDSPAATLSADPAALLDVRLGRIDVEAAIGKGHLRFEGSEASVRRLRRAIAL
ncbi:MAG TPA: winged helix-turn-helix transcriptional regulator, partial [Candidatus Acidoferrales bacterium]|nr:winged helix-turn-helix transcriptional regulator [Candidatus Acidoferrales bacterium]